MRNLLPIALLLTACGDGRAVGNGSDGGTAFIDGGTDAGDAGPVHWGGTWDFGEALEQGIPCDGGGVLYQGGVASGIDVLVDDDAGVRFGSHLGPLVRIAQTGHVDEPAISCGFVSAPDHQSSPEVFAHLTGRFLPGPARFEGSATMTGWDGQCTLTYSVSWTRLDGGQ